MSDKAKVILLERQAEIIEERTKWEMFQTNCSNDMDFYRYCDWKMNLLDEEAEQIRYVLEMGCCFDI